jgi:hypothetical protein
VHNSVIGETREVAAQRAASVSSISASGEGSSGPGMMPGSLEWVCGGWNMDNVGERGRVLHGNDVRHSCQRATDVGSRRDKGLDVERNDDVSAE